MPEIISRAAAVKLGLNRYFTGLPCKSGHIAERRADSYHCAECASLASMVSANKDLDRKRAHNANWRKKHPEIARRLKREHRLNNKDLYRANNFRWKYGMTVEDRDRMFEGQGNCCAICSATEPGGRGYWHTDHCHTTNKVRGVLCHRCNVALGHVRDSIPVLGRMIEYLEHHATARGNAVKADAQAGQQVPA